MISTEQLRKTIEECTQKRPSGQSVVFTSKFVEALARELLANRESWSVYQYRMRNPYNGQVTGWETIKPEQVDFILKETIAANVEFRIVAAPPAPAVPDFKALAENLVENLVDCGGADEEAVEQYLAFAEKACRAAMLAAAPEVSGE